VTTVDVAVIGRGLIGSAAARHLAEAGVSTALIGPAEPAERTSSPGPFSSHADEGRITRVTARNRQWATLAARSITRYPDIADLYVAADALVTDYSSVFFDFANLRRPMVFFAYDLESYRDNLRGFYLDYDKDLPGPVVTSEGALYDTLRSLDQVAQDYSGRYDEFLARFSPQDDGHAAERVVDHVFGTSGQRD